jgi:hypothetical protein
MNEEHTVVGRRMSEAERMKAKQNAQQMVGEMGDAAVRLYLVDILVEMWRLRRKVDALRLEVARQERCARTARGMAHRASALAAMRTAGYALAVAGGVVAGAIVW